MKTRYLILFWLTGIFTYAQETTVEKSVSGIQTGLIGIWGYHEAGLSESWALRTEIGMEGGFFLNNFYEGVGFLLTPLVTLEPRWYYNIGKRARAGKTISGNSGNFLSLKASYNPDLFVISNKDNISVVNQLSLIPTWGIRRNLGRHFTWETGLGLGYRYVFAKSAGFAEDEEEAAVNLHLRLGYRF